MKRTTKLSGFAYSLSAVGAVLVGIMAAWLTRSNPVTGGIVLLAAVIALFGLGVRWNRRLQRKRRQTSSSMLQI